MNMDNLLESMKTGLYVLSIILCIFCAYFFLIAAFIFLWSVHPAFAGLLALFVVFCLITSVVHIGKTHFE